MKKFEAGLAKLAASLSKPRATNKRDKLQERIGRLKEKYSGIARHYRIDMTLDESKEKVMALTSHHSVFTEVFIVCVKDALAECHVVPHIRRGRETFRKFNGQADQSVEALGNTVTEFSTGSIPIAQADKLSIANVLKKGW
jgi:hypothetical protein